VAKESGLPEQHQTRRAVLLSSLGIAAVYIEDRRMKEELRQLEAHWTFVGYQLGLHVANKILSCGLADRAADQLEALENIARGEWTPFQSGAELRREIPDEENVEQSLRDNQHALQRAANFVLDKFEKMV
jgi:hypothetical protein